MTDEEFQRITGFIKSAVDTVEDRFKVYLDQAEERFGNRLAVELAPIRQDITDLKGDVSDLKNDMRWVKHNMALESTVKERFERFAKMEHGDIGGVIRDTDRLKKSDEHTRKTVSALDKRVTALEEAGG